MAFDVLPLKTSINEDDARLVRFRRITNREAVVSPVVTAAYSLYLIREWPFISADQAKTLVDSLGSTISNPKADNVTYSGTWQQVYAQAYQDNPETSDRSVIIRQVLFLKDSNNPYTVTYEASCLKTVQVAMYWDITRSDAMVYIDAINATAVAYGAGWTADYRLFPGEEGLYNLIITYEHAIAFDSLTAIIPGQLLTSFDSADHTDEQRFMLNQITPTEPPADSLGIVYDANYRKNSDCTWDVTHTKRSSHPLGPKTVTGGTVGFREDDVVNRNLLAVPVVGEGALGITKSGRISINDDETIDATVSTRTAKPIGPTPTTSGTQGYTDVENTAVNAVAMPSPGIGLQGVTTNCNPSFNLDGTVNYSQKTRTATLLGPKNITGGTVGFREEDSITKNNYALPVVGEGGLGVTKSGRVALNDDGTMDATVSTRTAKPVGPGSATSGTVGHTDVGTIALNAVAIPSPGPGGKGVTNTVDPSYNLDATINYSQRVRTSALVGPERSIYGTLTEKEELEIARNSYTVPSPGQGPIGITNRVNIQLNEDATADYSKIKSTAVEITGTGASGSPGTHESETVARNSLVFPNPSWGVQANTTSFSASFNPDGTINKTTRTRTSQPIDETGTATNYTFTDAITVAKNQTTAPSPSGSQGVLKTFSASLNDDDTVDYTQRVRTATAKDSNPSLAGARAYEDRTVLSINQTTLLSPGRGAAGTVTSVAGSFNEDGTFDYTRRDRVAYQLGPVTSASGTLGATESTVLVKNTLTTPNPGAGGQGITNDLSVQFNDDGTYDSRTNVRTAVEVTGTGVAGSLYSRETITATINDYSFPSPGQGGQGTVISLSPSFNIDGTVNWIQRDTTSQFTGEKTITTGTVGYGDSITVAKNSLAVPSPGRGAQGVTNSESFGFNEDGTYDYNRTTRTVTKIDEEIISNVGTNGSAVEIYEAINDTAMPSLSAPVTGKTNQVSFSINQDGTINWTKTIATATKLDTGAIGYEDRYGRSSVRVFRNATTAEVQGLANTLLSTTNNSVAASLSDDNTLSGYVASTPFKFDESGLGSFFRGGFIEWSYIKIIGKWAGKNVVIQHYGTGTRDKAEKFCRGTLTGYEEGDDWGSSLGITGTSYSIRGGDSEGGQTTNVYLVGENFKAVRVLIEE